MITINAEQCDGCGECMEVCPNSALYLFEGTAMVDEELCNECEACVAVCPTGAIGFAEPLALQAPSRVPTIRPEPEVVLVESQAAPVPLPGKALTVVSAS